MSRLGKQKPPPSASSSHQVDMWLISGLFDGPVVGNLDIPLKQKLLKPNRSYMLGRQLKDLNVNDKRISSVHCEFIVGPHTLDDAGNPSARPTLEIVSHVQKAKGISYTRADGTSGILGPNDRTFLHPDSCVALMSKAAVTLTWKPIIAVGKDIPLASCADMGIKLLQTPHKEATHHLISHYAANMLTAGSLVTNSCFVKPEWLREVLRLGALPATDAESLEVNFVAAMPQESKFRPAFSPSLLPEQKNFALWQANEARLKLFHAHRFVCLQEKMRESDGELRDTVRLGDGEVDSFDVSLGVVKFRTAVTRSRNKEGKTTVLIGDADLMQLAVGKDGWLHFVKEAKTFELQILPPAKVIQAILEGSVDILASNAEHQQQDSSPLPEIVANTMASEPSLAPEAPKPTEDGAPSEPTPAPRRKLVRRAASRATSTEPSIPPTFPATATIDTETLMRPRKVLTRRAVGANPIITGLANDPSVSSVVLDEPPKVGAADKPVSQGKPDSASKVPPTPLRNPRLKRRVIGGTIIDSDAPRIGLGGYVAATKPQAQPKEDNGEPPLKKFKALFESTNPGGSGVETFEIMNSVPIDSLSQMPMQSGSNGQSQTQTQTQTQTPSQLGMPPPAQGPPSRFGRPTASVLDVLREEEEEGTQSLLGATRGTKRTANGDGNGDVDMAQVNGGGRPAAKKRAIENINAVEPSGSKPPSKSKTITSKNTPGAPVGKPDKDTAFLKAVASSKRGKKTEDEFDREFNKLKISRPVLDEREDDQQAEWKVLADFGDDEGLRGNFMTIVEMEVFRNDRDGQAGPQRCRNPVWDGKPNFKKFKKKVVNSRAKVDLFLSDTNDYGMGAAYWKGGESSQNANQAQASMFGGQMQSQLNVAAGTQADNRPLMDSDDDTPLPKSRKAPSRAGSVRPSRAGSAAPMKKPAMKASAKASGSKSKKSGAALFLDSDDEIKEEDEDDVVVIDDDPDTMTLHSSAEAKAPAPSRRTTSRAGAATQAPAKTAKTSSKSKKAAPIIVEDDSDDEAVFKGFRGRR